MSRLKELRRQQDPPWSQRRLYLKMRERESLPDWPTMKTRISMWENGRATPEDFYISLLADVFQVPEDALGFNNDHSSVADFFAPVRSPKLAVAAGMTQFLTTEFDRYAQVDREHGPAMVLNLVRAQCATVEQALADANSHLRGDLLKVGAKFFEFGGWLAQDTGNLEGAEKATTRALDMAYEAGDLALTSYIFMRRSNIAAERGNAQEALSFARSALMNKEHLSSQAHALALRTEGRAHTLGNDERNAIRCIADAMELVAHTDGPPDPLAEYCTHGYLEMERTVTYLQLGKPAHAIEPLTRAVESWHEADQRDKGIALARLAHAHALAGDIEASIDSSQRCLDVVRAAPSSRALSELQEVASRLGRRKDQRASGLLNEIRGLQQ